MGIPEVHPKLEIKRGEEASMEVSVVNRESSRTKDLYRVVEILNSKDKDPNTSGYTTLIKDRDVIRYISQLAKNKGYGIGSVKSTLRVKHIPSENNETLVSVGTLNLSGRGAPIIHIPIFASMESVVRGEVYLTFKSCNKNGTYQAHLISMDAYLLAGRLKDDHMFHSVNLIRSDNTLVTLTAKDNRFVELLGHVSEDHSPEVKDSEVKEGVFKKMLVNLYTIFATEQTLSNKQIDNILDSYIGNSYVFYMNRTHIDNLISRLKVYGDFYYDNDDAGAGYVVV